MKITTCSRGYHPPFARWDFVHDETLTFETRSDDREHREPLFDACRAIVVAFGVKGCLEMWSGESYSRMIAHDIGDARG
jgi:hypothetical protein